MLGHLQAQGGEGQIRRPYTGPAIKWLYMVQVDGLVQERRNSSALAVELRLSCTNPLRQCLARPSLIDRAKTPYLHSISQVQTLE